MRRTACFIVAVLIWASACFAQIPTAALAHRRVLIANARAVWGLTAPVAVVAAQIHQESGWRVDAKSKYASGLAQFTPDTATWISGVYPELVSNQPLSPAWALQAVVRYDDFLLQRMTAATPCDRWAFTLSAYNGGEGNLRKDVALAKKSGADPTRWWGHVEHFSNRAGWAFHENREYEKRIMLLIQPRYLTWGPGVDCQGVS